MTSALRALENIVTFLGKPDWLSPFLLMYWSCSPGFLFKKGRLSQIISKVAVQKCSLRYMFETFQKFSGNHPWWSIFVS